MPEARILIVEDDAIIGRHIQTSLKRMEYGVLGVLLTGEEAVEQALQHEPDLILMDISLAGAMDGVEAASQIRHHLDIPIIYLTAYADQQTLQRAKITDPFGYLLKPFDERLLRITVEMALYRHKIERRLVESEEMLRTLVENQLEGVSIMSPEGTFIFSNPALEAIFGVAHGQLMGRNIREFTDPDQNDFIRGQVDRRRQGQKSVYEIDIRRMNGEIRTISVMATPWIDKIGNFAGSFGIINDITASKQIEAAELRARVLAEALRDTAAALNSSLDIREVYDLILMNVGRVVANDSANMMLIEGDLAQIVHSRFETGLDSANLAMNIQVPWREFEISRKMVETSQPVLISTVAGENIFSNNQQMSWMKSYVGAPLRTQDRVIGFINLGSKTPGFYQDYHANQLEAFANQAVLAIVNARLFEETRKRTLFLTMLNDITRLAINMMDEGQTFDAVAEKMTQLFQADAALITLWDEELQLTIPAAGYGLSSETLRSVPMKPGDLTLTASVLRAGRALAVDDVKNSPYIDRDLAIFFSMQSMMGLPLIADGIRLGAVLVSFNTPHCFTQEEINNGEQVSSQVALAVSKARLYSQVQRMSITDELTGLYNRRGIFEKGRAAVVEAQRFSKPLALIWLDIDYFKRVNDTYGHHIGDQVVRGVAECCRASVRDRDLIGRYGGEGGDELILMLPETNLSDTLLIAERVRQRIASQMFDTDKGPIAVTVSMGISVLRGDMVDLTGLLNRADQAMYAAKSAGRNCVVVAEEA